MAEVSRKRPMSEDMMDGTEVKKHGIEVTLKVLVPASLAGSIIGKKGENIIGLQKESGARIRMSNSDEFYPGTGERVCLIVGSIDGIFHVHSFIMDKIKEKADAGGNSERGRQAKLLVPNTTAGIIIGKKGVTVEQIKEASGAYIQVSPKPDGPYPSERCITVSGEEGAIKQSVRLILERICDDPLNGAYPSVSYKDSEYRSKAAIGSGMQQLHLSGPLAAGLNGAMLDTIRQTLKTHGFEGAALEDVSAAFNTLAGYNLLSVSLTAQGVGLSLPPSLQLSGFSSSGSMNSSAQFDSLSQNGNDQGVYGPLGTTTSAGDSFSYSGAYGAVKDEPEEEASIEVPDSLVGLLLGRGGSEIMNLQHSTGTRVKVSNKGVFAPGTENRIATIKGPRSGVRRAEALIREKIFAEQSRREQRSLTREATE